MTILLGIETSCDETAAAIVDSDKNIRSHVVLSQVAEHAAYGGVVPEIAARSHMEHLERIIHKAMTDANLTFANLDGIAVTAGPGLIGGVIVGVMTAKAIASVHQKPLIAVNHLEGHALTVRLTNDVPFPYLMLLASGGHCQFLIVEGVGRYRYLGGTLDDALGEAFDKVAKMLGLAQPGGPMVEKRAKQGDAKKYHLPTPLKDREGCDFSFAGLKTAVRLLINSLPNRGRVGVGASTEDGTNNAPLLASPLLGEEIADICAAFQHAACECVVNRTSNAIAAFKALHPNAPHFVLAGGVAANMAIRGALEGLLSQHHMQLIAPPIALCTDNAAMIAWAGIERFRLGLIDPLTFEPRARWPLYLQAA